VDLTFITVLLVFEVPEREGIVESGLKELSLGSGDTFASHVLEVDEVSLVVVKDEVGLDELVSFLLLLFLFDGSDGNNLGGLDLNLKDGLHGLGSGGDDTTDLDERREGDDALEPSSDFTHSFAETLIEHGLEGHDVTVGDNEVGNSEGVSTDPLVVSESDVEGFEVFLAGLVGVGENLCGGILLESEDGHKGGHHSGGSSADLPLDPLVTDGLLVSVGSVKSGMSIGEVSGNSNRLMDATIISLKHGVFAGHVLTTGSLSFLLGFIEPDHVDLSTSFFSDESGELSVGRPSGSTVKSSGHNS